MRLYSIQTVAAWEVAQARGYLTGNHDHQGFDDWPQLERAYHFMQACMTERLTDYSGDLPVWAWLTDPRTRERDSVALNSSEKMAPFVLLTIEVPESRLVLSSLDAYHAVINGWYLSLTEEEDDRLHKDGRTPTEEEKTASWERIFRLHPESPEETHWRGAYDPNDVQACIDRVHLNEVVDVSPFKY